MEVKGLRTHGDKTPDSHSVDEMGLLVKEKKGTWIKSCRESSKRETEVFAIPEGVAEAAKVDDGTRRTRIKKGLKQLRKARCEKKGCKITPGRSAGEGGKGAGAGAAIARELGEGARWKHWNQNVEDQTPSARRSGK